jgi:hypothetical protein
MITLFWSESPIKSCERTRVKYTLKHNSVYNSCRQDSLLVALKEAKPFLTTAIKYYINSEDKILDIGGI